MVSIDRTLLDRGIRHINAEMSSHAGAVELVSVADDGAVSVRYTGMCTGCPYRPVTSAKLVRPVLLEIPGVTTVEILGSRISAEAEERMARYLTA